MIKAKLSLLSHIPPFRRVKRKVQQKLMNHKMTMPTRLIRMRPEKKTVKFVCINMVLKSIAVPSLFMEMKNVFIVCVTDVYNKLPGTAPKVTGRKKRKKTSNDKRKVCKHDLFQLKMEDNDKQIARKNPAQQGKKIPAKCNKCQKLLYM